MSLLLWIVVILIGPGLLWWFILRGRLINWLGLAKALPGIVFDVVHQIALSIADAFGLIKYKRGFGAKRDDYDYHD